MDSKGRGVEFVDLLVLSKIKHNQKKSECPTVRELRLLIQDVYMICSAVS